MAVERFEEGDRKVRILIVDDHEVVRKGLVQLIGQESDMEVCGEADDADVVVEFLARNEIDVVIMDIYISGITGIQLTERLKSLYPDLQVVVLTICDDLAYVKRAFRAGASAYVSKGEASESIIEAIRAVAAGKTHVSRAIAEKIIEGRASQSI